MSDVRERMVTAVNAHLRRGAKFSAAVVLARQEFLASADTATLSAFAEMFFDEVVHGFWGGRATDDYEDGNPTLPGQRPSHYRQPGGSVDP